MKQLAAIMFASITLAGSLASSLGAQEGDLASDFRREGEHLSEGCGKFKIVPCASTLFTDHPMHIAVGSLAPQNGFAAGPAFVFEKHTAPKKKKDALPGESGSRWRFNVDGDVVVSSNRSWRAGAYLNGMYIPGHRIAVLTGPPPPGFNPNLTRRYALFHVYAQGESLNKLIYYGLGQGSSRGAQSFYGMRETIAGVSAEWPLMERIGLMIFGEANARSVSLRGNTSEGGPSIEQRFTDLTAPGLANQPAFAQFGQGIRMEPSFLNDRVKLNYSAALQEFAAPGSHYSFERLTVDLSHEYAFYGTSVSEPPKAYNGPNSCAKDQSKADCPAPDVASKPRFRLTKSSDRAGNLIFRFLLTDSFAGSGNAVPFYFQPTLGGSDIQGQMFLPSYADYRFRAPNLMVFHEGFEHSIWGPIGFAMMADQGKVAATRGDIGFDHLAHSFATGITLRAGGFPVVSLMFAWGGKEGTHNLALVNTALLGASSRPSLF